MSGATGVIRKVYDIGPTQITSNGNYDGSGSPTTSWATGLLTPAGTGAGLLWLTQLIQSINDNGRVGQSVACETLDIRVRLTPQPSVVGYQHVRMLVVADNECDGTSPTLQEILGSSSLNITTIATGLDQAFLQPAFFGRFHVLEDKNWYYYVSSTANSFTENDTDKSFYHESHHDLKGHRVMWDTTDASAIGNARKGHIFMYFLYSNSATATGGLAAITSANPPAVHLTTRLRYHD